MMSPVLAYVGPGAGFAFLGSFLGVLASLVVGGISIVLWPFRAALAVLRRGSGYRKARIRRLIFLGLDGLDPGLTERYMAQGKLPHLSQLKQAGSYHRLRTTFPSLSPVAWSTFATGVHPAKHNIFDFLNRSLKSYVPELSSSRVRPARRVWKLGRLRIPLSRPVIEFRRKSRTFWKILGERNIRSTILRVPITFPPEEFEGHQLSAMCTPDLRGTQGSFSLFTTGPASSVGEGGGSYALKRDGEWLSGMLEGPLDELHQQGRPLAIPFRVREAGGEISLDIDGARYGLRQGEYSSWIRLSFRAAPGVHVRGIARFLVTSTQPEFSLYVTPIQIDPEAPALPISHPPYYAAYLARLLGTYATLGMAEDTWALNEGAIDEAAFLEQAWLTLAEREAMFENALEHTPRGVVACVFDTSDRVQHMFFRHLDGEPDAKWSGTVEELYARMDGLVGKAMRHADEQTVLMVLSDHGFCHFRRAVNLNSWLYQNGFLALRSGLAESRRYFEGVDWSRTRAYCLGLSGIYLNLRGREAQGIVAPGSEAEALKAELMQKLSGLRDQERAGIAIRRVYATDQLYRGPYLEAAPDLIAGFNAGYRISWEAAIGQVTGAVFEDNRKAWSGDHCVDPLLVPGVLFCSRPITGSDPGIEDMAPTALELFGVELPAWMDGKPLLRAV
jgi:predicted AlkP superfamily phosphohydrolase/phosphomutase